jgi:hypothetical protein
METVFAEPKRAIGAKQPDFVEFGVSIPDGSRARLDRLSFLAANDGSFFLRLMERSRKSVELGDQMVIEKELRLAGGNIHDFRGHA